MHDPKIIKLQKELASQRETYRNHENSINHKNYQNTRNKLQKVIKETKANFLRKAHIDKLKVWKKKVWNTVDRILNKQHNRIKLHPSNLNTHFTTLASRLTHKGNEPYDFTDFFSIISEETGLEIFKIKRHNLSQTDQCKLIHNNEPVEWLNSTKILGVHFDENLTWITHVNNLIKFSHATLRSLRLFKRFTPYEVLKTLAETLILSNLRYCIPVYSQLPKYLI